MLISRIVFVRVMLLCFLALPVVAQDVKPLTNQDVIRLVKLGLSAEVIITKIAESPAAYDLSIEGLATLAQNRVPNEVIKAMQAKAPSAPRRAAADITPPSVAPPMNAGAKPAAGAMSYPLLPDKGVYLWDGKTQHLLHRSDAASTGQNFWRSMTPFVKKKIELQLVGAYAKVHVSHNQPTILVSGLGEVIPGVPAFRLLYVKTGGMRKDRRIVGTYDVGGFFGSLRRVDNEIECEVRKVADGVYAFTPVKPLADGEYGLVQSSVAAASPLIWDFGIYAEEHPTERKK